jgi:hypothetical protein
MELKIKHKIGLAGISGMNTHLCGILEINVPKSKFSHIVGRGEWVVVQS